MKATKTLKHEHEAVKLMMKIMDAACEKMNPRQQLDTQDMDDMIDRMAQNLPHDDLALRRLKKRRLLLRDQIARLEVELDPPTPA